MSEIEMQLCKMILHGLDGCKTCAELWESLRAQLRHIATLPAAGNTNGS